ncbi:hypothetical protein HY464_01295, partial [Candidatus Peregrinibacteria bacterium]|nr:hypothetical protein [Candidatus Peregrinibacteria bacterium]
DDALSVAGDLLIGEVLSAVETTNIPGNSVIVGNGTLCVDNGGTNCDDSARTAGTIYAVSTTIGNMDLAENYPTKDNTIVAGEVVALDPLRPIFVKRASGLSSEVLLGVVSTAPGLLLGGFDSEQFADERQVPVALSGRIPVKVNREGGPIAIGDSLTLSSTAGVARRGNGTGQILGTALQAFTGSSVGTIEMFVQLGERPRAQKGGMGALEILSGDMGNEDVRAEVSSLDLRAQVEQILLEKFGTLDTPEEKESEDMEAQEVSGNPNAFLVGKNLSVRESAYLRGGLRVEGKTILTGSMRVGGMLTASETEIEKTLSVLGDARVAGDLHLEGALRAHDLFVPGTLQIDGGASIAGTLQADRILAGSGSIVSGLLTINGDLRISSGSLILGSDSLLTVQDILIEKALVVLGDITIKGLATFEKDVEILGELRVSDRQAGYAVVPRGGTGVTVTFGTGFLTVPVVTAAPDVPMLYAVSRATQSGFTIRLASPASEDVTFSWLALFTQFPKTHSAISTYTELASSSSTTSILSETGSSSVQSEDASQVSAPVSVEGQVESSSSSDTPESQESSSSSSLPEHPQELAEEGTNSSMESVPVSVEGSSSSDTSESQESSSSSSLPSVWSSSSSTDNVVEENTEFPITSNQ